jgi:predicted HicB family RNase H-like nuclease
MPKEFKKAIDESHAAFISTSKEVKQRGNSKFNNEKIKDGIIKMVSPKKKELKSRAIHILVKPSIYEALQTTAKSKKLSLNEVINQLLELSING